MKYSFWLDIWLTGLLWYVLGFTLTGFLIAAVVGTMLSVKLSTAWCKAGGLRAIAQRVLRRVLRKRGRA